MGSNNESVLELDALIVGAGFSGIYILHRLRDELKLNVKIIDAGSDLGGTWHWNTYPGARVDCPAPWYAFGMEEVWKTWDWSERYPGYAELQAYFQHVDRVLAIKKDCIFNTRVTAASFDPATAKWTIQTADGLTVLAKYFIPAVGFAAQEYVPPWKGLDSFEGTIHHSSLWPKEGVDVRGKRVAIVGTGATGVQIVQDWAKEAAEVLVFQRTPNISLPMDQKQLDSTDQEEMRVETAELLARCHQTGSGLGYEEATKTFDQFSREEFVEQLNRLYDQGGFRYWTGGCQDVLLNPDANRMAYDVWAKRTRARIQDPVKRDLLAPLEPPHPFGTKRPALEQDYYEQFNKPNVNIVDTKAHPIEALTPQGIVTSDHKLHEVDVIVLATGFDASTGSLARLGVRDINGVDLITRWREGVTTFLGLMVPGFPNMFLPYSVQAPTPFTNGPIFIEFQANFIRDLIKKAQTSNISSVDPHSAAAEAWGAEVHAVAQMTLLPQAKSWYMGANIPGKKVELLYYFGGLHRYREVCGEVLLAKLDKSFVCNT